MMKYYQTCNGWITLEDTEKKGHIIVVFLKVQRIVKILDRMALRCQEELLAPQQDLHLELFSHQKLILCSFAHNVTFHQLFIEIS